ncbi:MAG: HEAT repeat domain-containing protein [Verrucomicrobiae bacterium]|nr:HEAT repeat domain-containing protein [Verrucomicrobiae bacterium]
MNSQPNPGSEFRDDPRSTDELLALALASDPDRDDEGYWKPIAILQRRLPWILNEVQALSRSTDLRCREAAATILGQGWVGEKFAGPKCVGILLQMLPVESDPLVLASIASALGNHRDARAVEPLTRLSTHADPKVRVAAVSNLYGYDDSRLITALVDRTSDPDRDVRNWATFGLGSQVDADTPVIREALLARTEDEDAEIRGEAIVGLARRGDVRVVAALLKELESEEADVLRKWVLMRDAADEIVSHASATGSPEWTPVLTKLRELEIGEATAVCAALDRCTPAAP